MNQKATTTNIIVIDNYDSFTYNLVHQIATVLELALQSIKVIRNDSAQVADILALDPSHLILSPGPGQPETSKLSLALLQTPRTQTIPTLGVCLGHQAIVYACGGRVNRATRPIHGHNWQLQHTTRGIFEGVPAAFKVARYHSLIAQTPLPDCLTVEAYSPEGEVMAVSHRVWPWWGLQFHPESFMTEYGDILIGNFFNL